MGNRSPCINVLYQYVLNVYFLLVLNIFNRYVFEKINSSKIFVPKFPAVIFHKYLDM